MTAPASLICPRCALHSPPSAMLCDCGYNFIEEARGRESGFRELGPLPPDVRGPSSSSAWYVVRHFRGDLSLGVSWWVNGTLLANLIPGMLFAWVRVYDEHETATLSGAARLGLVALALSLVFWIWVVVGLWRSARKHANRGGSGFVAFLVQGVILLGGLTSAVALTRPRTHAGLRELIQLASDADPLSKIEAVLSPDGRTLLLEGSIGQGSAAKVERMLNTYGKVATLQLSSGGGRVLEARAIARSVRARQIDTYVDGECDSACTLIFLAGSDRGATERARLGFHRPSFAGFDSQQTSLSEMLDAYDEANLSGDFLKRVMATASDAMWYPTHAELIENNIITRVAAAGESATWRMRMKSIEDLRAMAREDAVWVAAEQRFPAEQQRALEAAWHQVQSGTPDAEVAAGMHAALSVLKAEALRTAADRLLERHLTLSREVLALARELKPEYCRGGKAGLATSGGPSLDGVFTRAVLELQRPFEIELLSSAPVDLPPPRRAAMHAAMRRAGRGLTMTDRQILSDRANPSWRAEMVCSATIAFFDAVGRLPPGPRVQALHLMFRQPEAPADGAAAEPVARKSVATRRPRPEGSRPDIDAFLKDSVEEPIE